MAEFYVKRGDHQFGPYKSSRLKQHADEGRVIPSDLVRQGEEGKWYPASTVKGLFSQAPAVPVAKPVERPLIAQDGSPRSTPTEAPQPADTNPNLHACPDCGAMVSKRASACPSCGAPFLGTEGTPSQTGRTVEPAEQEYGKDDGPGPATPQARVRPRKTPRHQPLWQRTGVVFAAIVAVFAISGILVLMFVSDQTREEAKDEIQELRAEAEAAAEEGHNASAELKDYDAAILHYTKAIKIAQQLKSDAPGWSSPILVKSHNGLGMCYRGKGDFDKALAEFNEAIRIGELSSYVDILGPVYAHKGGIYRRKAEKASTAEERKHFEALSDEAHIESQAYWKIFNDKLNR